MTHVDHICKVESGELVYGVLKIIAALVCCHRSKFVEIEKGVSQEYISIT